MSYATLDGHAVTHDILYAHSVTHAIIYAILHAHANAHAITLILKINFTNKQVVVSRIPNTTIELVMLHVGKEIFNVRCNRLLRRKFVYKCICRCHFS